MAALPLSVALRPVRLANRTALAQLGRETYAQHFSHLWSPQALAAYLETNFGDTRLAADLQPDANVRYYFVERQAVVLGYVKLKPHRPLPLAPNLPGLELEKIYFRKAAAGQGAGHETLQWVLQEAAALGEKRIWLDVLKSNVRAVQFYERFGFARVGELPFATDRAAVGMWVMQRTV